MLSITGGASIPIESWSWSRHDRGIVLFVLGYALATFAIALHIGQPGKFAPFAYTGYVIPGAFVSWAIGVGLWSLFTDAPLASLKRAAHAWATPEGIRAVLLFGVLTLHMGVFTSLKTLLPDMVPFYADRALADLDEFLHGQAAWQLTTAALPEALSVPLARLYYGLWGLLLPGCLLAVIISPRLRAVRAQYLWTYVVIWPLLGNAVAVVCMSAGPIFYEQVTGDAQRFGPLVAHLGSFSLMEGKEYLWRAYITHDLVAAGGISAFPSMHLANATLFALLAARVNRVLGAVAVLFVLVVLAGSVHLGWHYAVDGYFAIGATLLVWRSVGLALGRKSRSTVRVKGPGKSPALSF